MNGMQLAANAFTPLAHELEVMDALLPFEDAVVLELGCGNAAKTRAIAQRFSPAQLVAAEVDERAQTANRAAQATWPQEDEASKIRFVDYAAQAIALPDASVDIVLMFKSLHHVPGASLPQAMREISRVLKPGGYAYFSEPVFAGELNEVIRLFHDEQQVRAQAFAALRDAVDAGLLELVEERFFRTRVQFTGFQQFADGIIHATHSSHQLSSQLYARVEATFNRYHQANGGEFETPIRVDLLRCPLK